MFSLFNKTLVVISAFVLSLAALAQQAEAADEEAVIEEIIVTGRAQQLYRVGTTDTARLPTDRLSSSQIITTINADLIRDQGARDAQDIYRNIAGVSIFSYAGVTARGFRQEGIFYDGLRGDPYVGFNVPQLFNIERVDFLKGPAGMLYGAGAPGGVFNYVTKKPSEDFFAQATAVAGTEARYGGSLDINGSLPMENVSGRMGIFYEDRDTPRKHSGNETTIFDAGLLFDLDFADLTLQATHYEQNLAGNRLRGVLVDDEGNFLASRRWNHNETSDFLNMKATTFQSIFEGEVGDSFTWNLTMRYTKNEQEQNYHEPRGGLDIEELLGLPTDGSFDIVLRQFRDQFREEEQFALGANLIWSKEFDNFSNRLLFGYDYFDSTNEFLSGGLNPTAEMIGRFLMGTSLSGDILPLSLLDPQYGDTQPENYDIQFRAVSITDQKRNGAYLIDEVTIGNFIVLGGLRFDDFKDGSGDTKFSDNKLTYRLGLTYILREDVSLFGQWADSYEPQSVGSQNPDAGGPFEPTEGTILEFGVKTELADGRIQTNASIYRIVRTNILQSDPAGDPEGDGVDNLIAFGEVTSKGFELDVAMDLNPNWVVTASYAYNDTKITKDNGLTNVRNSVGDRFANAPKHQMGFWTRYQVQSINTAFAFGGDYLSKRLSLAGQKVKPSFIIDASVIWSPGPVEIMLRVDNLFDETYAASGFTSNTGHFPGDPRSVFIEISKEW